MQQRKFQYRYPTECNIVPVGKRRDGGTRYWCLKHKADATAKYGTKGKKCKYADIPEITNEETFAIDVEEYPGGIALWGAVPPIYDTTNLELDRGIHVHARKTSRGKKTIDKTYRKVFIKSKHNEYSVTELDAIYYMVSSVLGFPVKSVICNRCSYPHLDKDWFSVHPHISHLCAGCGRNFRDDKIAIGNPIAELQSSVTGKTPKTSKSKSILNIRQKDYLGGIQIWGSNPSILWTSATAQETGIHVHAYKSSNSLIPDEDGTFGTVIIDGIKLDEVQVRTYMAQLSLPHLAGRVQLLQCSKCNILHFDNGNFCFTPRVERKCCYCNEIIKSKGRLKKVISNPILGALTELAKYTPLATQNHELGLIPETI